MKTHDRMNFYAPGEIGNSRRITPEGFLVCEGVAIARTGIQLYRAEEVPLEPDAAGDIRIERIPGEVFREETIASFEGKPVTVEHPNEFVTPENWERYAVGTVQHVRRGTGINDDLLIADLVITKADAIAYVNRSIPELSAGYESEYEQSLPGRGLQRNIIGNHVALVERGRAGPRVSIRDHQPGVSMKGKFFDRLVRLFTAIKANDEAAVGEIAKEIQDSETDPASGMEARLKQAEDWIKDRMAKDAAAEEEEAKKKKEAEDAILSAEAAGRADVGKVYTGDELKEIFSRAEILAPGIAIPTGDAQKAKDTAPALMLKALQTADATEAGKAAIKPFLLGRDLKALTGDALLGVFTGAAEMARLTNNRAAQRSSVSTRDFSKPGDVAAINKANAEFWAGR